MRVTFLDRTIAYYLNTYKTNNIIRKKKQAANTYSRAREFVELARFGFEPFQHYLALSIALIYPSSLRDFGCLDHHRVQRAYNIALILSQR